MTIGQLVEKSGAQIRIFDLGRRIEKVSKKDFADFEQLAKPYPVPYLKHAWVGVLSWNPKQAGQHNIWFLKLPLDEQNFLQPGPRDAFLEHWLRVVADPDKEHGEAPCSFKPDQNRMAYFHSIALMTLGQPTTQYYSTSRAYLSGDLGWDNWQQLGLQGLAEVVARLGQDNNEALLSGAIGKMPAVPRNVLLGYLENAQPGHDLTVAVNDCLSQVVAAGPEAGDLAAFARALSRSVNIQQRQLLLQAILAHPVSRSVEVLAALGSRCWQDLSGERLLAYLEVLADNEEAEKGQGTQVFCALVADLMTLPGMREQILQAFRNPQRSDKLSAAIGELMSLVNAADHTVQ